jgi:hypothetical protein
MSAGAVEDAPGVGRAAATRRLIRALSMVCLAAAVLLIAAGGDLLALGQDGAVCSFRAQTGRPCPGCGGTRAFSCAVRGEVATAFRFNLMGALAGLAAWLVALGALASGVSGRAVFLQSCLMVVVVAAPLALGLGIARWFFSLGGL